MPVWYVLLVLQAALGSRLGDGPCSAEELKAAKDNAERSPWFQEHWKTFAGYEVTYDDILGSDCSGATGHPSKLTFTKTNSTHAPGAAGPAGHPFSAVLKVDRWGRNEKKYVPEAELTQIAGEQSGLIVGLIQGATQLTSDTGYTYVLSQFIEGVPVKDLFTPGLYRKPGPYVSRALIAQLVFILRALRRAYIVHRDFKFENVILTPPTCQEAFSKSASDAKSRSIWIEHRCKIVLIDFGVACTYLAWLVHNRQRLMGCHSDLVGTPLWIAPEVVMEEGPSDTSDVFAAGIFVSTLLTGEYPQDTWANEVHPELPEDNPPLRALVATLQMDTKIAVHKVKDVIVKNQLEQMLHKDPASRPSPDALWGGRWLDFKTEHAPEMEGADKDHYRKQAEQADADAFSKRVAPEVLRRLPAANTDREEQAIERLYAKYGDAEIRHLQEAYRQPEAHPPRPSGHSDETPTGPHGGAKDPHAPEKVLHEGAKGT